MKLWCRVDGGLKYKDLVLWTELTKVKPSKHVSFSIPQTWPICIINLVIKPKSL